MQACVKITCIFFCVLLISSLNVLVSSNVRYDPLDMRADAAHSEPTREQPSTEIYVCTYSPNVPPAPDTSSVTHVRASKNDLLERMRALVRRCTLLVYSYYSIHISVMLCVSAFHVEPQN